ncbi:pyridoxal-dependent decarboxylase [Streptomyces sp. JJ38]|uniref:pyridoxal phosphate-dependent decarboxylase family protein n=1 Tax=Streptomyces sp. JJ38 TaxID=2738128 RepID=UPI001C591530|nr:pyridoxal-dependent decarboxylase [Streptomyces sp. JJ38]MBW1599526.1 aspartate aminotransferase family protein [Streptomyces sp. JJ38]
MSQYPDTAIAAGPGDPRALRALTAVALDALADGAAARGGPLPDGGPDAVTARTRGLLAPVLPEHGVGAPDALYDTVRATAQGAADPGETHCVAHLHCPPLAVAAAADLAASALNPSMDSWDQAPAAAVIEEEVTAALAALMYPAEQRPDALITSGGTESNLVALLLARERVRAATGGTGTLHVLCGENAHHSVHRAAWILGLPAPRHIPCPGGRMDPDAVDATLAELGERAESALVVATAGTTDAGLIDPLPELALAARRHGAELHVDAAYGGPLLFSEQLAGALRGIEHAVSVTFDLHKMGWQPVAAGVLAVPDAELLNALSLRADYLNADDDTEAGLPDLLGRSLRTSRRPDALKIAVTLRALGRSGLGGIVEHCVRTARQLGETIDAHPALRRRPGPVGISTVLFRPLAADGLPGDEGDALVADIRRQLLNEGLAVLGRAKAPDHDGTAKLWLKATLLHPQTAAADLEDLLKLVAERAEPTPTAAVVTLPAQQARLESTAL